MQRIPKLLISIGVAALLGAAAYSLLGSTRDDAASAVPARQSQPSYAVAERDVVAAVSGRVAWVSPALASGGEVARDQVILRLESRELAAVLEHAEAEARQYQRDLDNAIAHLERIGSLFEQGVASQSEMDDAVAAHKSARSALRQAWLGVKNARRDLEGTEVRAPVDGRVIAADVEVGQFVSQGSRVALLSHETA